MITKRNKEMEHVNLKIEDNVAVISIVRPEALNALNRSVVDELGEAVSRVETNDSIRCLVIYSEKNFAAGADIKVMADCNEEEAKAFAFSPVYNRIEDMDMPTIAAISGFALGGGMELALTADMRIAGESAKIGFPEVTLGIFPGAGGTIRAPRLIGEAFAKEMIFTGDTVDADRALQMGLVNRVVKDEAVYDEAIKLANRIAKRGPVAIRMAKEVIRKGLETQDQNQAIEIEAREWAKLFHTYDQKEGMKAFIEKRKPDFQNR